MTSGPAWHLVRLTLPCCKLSVKLRQERSVNNCVGLCIRILNCRVYAYGRLHSRCGNYIFVVFLSSIYLLLSFFLVLLLPHVGLGQLLYPLFPRVHSLPHLLLFFYFLPFSFLICFTCFLLLSIPSLSTKIVPLHFQARGRRRQPNLGLVCYGRPM